MSIISPIIFIIPQNQEFVKRFRKRIIDFCVRCFMRYDVFITKLSPFLSIEKVIVELGRFVVSLKLVETEVVCCNNSRLFLDCNTNL